MKKVNKKNEIKNKDLTILVLLVPILLVIAVASYFLLKKIAKDNRKVCTFVGGLWERKPTADDPAPIHRCYTYEEFYE